MSILILGFQNCTGSFGFQLSDEITSSSKALSASVSGNGEGYGGKIDGTYANVDSSNQCGQATDSQFPVRQQIEIQNGVARKTIENCKRLSDPKPVSLSEVQTTSKKGQVLIFGDQVYEKADWTATGFAPRDQFVHNFCQGESKDPQTTLWLEALIYSKVSYIYQGADVTVVNSGYQTIITSSNGVYVQNGNQIIDITDGNVVIQNTTGSVTSEIPPAVLSSMKNPLCWSSD